MTAAIADGVPIGPAAGSCGTDMAYRGQTVISADIEQDPVWKGFSPLMLANGLRASGRCRSSPRPTRCSGPSPSTTKEPRRPTPEDLALLQVASGLAAVAIEQRGLTDQIAHQAHHDALTGLPNRVLFEDRLRNGGAPMRIARGARWRCCSWTSTSSR